MLSHPHAVPPTRHVQPKPAERQRAAACTRFPRRRRGFAAAPAALVRPEQVGLLRHRRRRRQARMRPRVVQHMTAMHHALQARSGTVRPGQASACQ